MLEQEPLIFESLEPALVPVKLAGVDYVLKEASGDAGTQYRNSIYRATKLGPDGKAIGFEGLADADPFLVSLCLFQVTAGGHKAVSIQTVRSWPNRVQKALASRIRDISDLDEEDAENIQKQIEVLQKRLEKLKKGDPTKNGLASTGDGSDSHTS